MTASLDFALSEDQLALREVADRILDDHTSPEQLNAVEQRDDWFARDAWCALATAGLLGAGLPEALGGGDGSFLDTAIVLEAIGRHVAPVPMLASIVGGAMPIARYGDDLQREQWVRPALAGDVILAAA